MKKLILLFLSVLCLNFTLLAQNEKDVRTNSTRIADFLRQLPADNAQRQTAAMEEIAGLDEAGLIALVNMLGPVASSDNAKVEYAISGFSGYVTLPGRESMRTKTALAYSKALKENQDAEARSFLMSQLGWIGQDESVPYLSAYLSDPRLVGPASRALVEINSDASRQALVQGLSAASQQTAAALLEAVGQSKATGGLELVTSYSSSDQEDIRKTALYALAKIADPSSAETLAAAAASADYKYDYVHAFGAYLDYIHQLEQNGHEAIALKYAQKLNKDVSGQTAQARIAALQLLADLQGEKSMDLLASAAKDKDKVYRLAALKMGEQYMISSQSAFWIKQLKKSSPDARAELIDLLGNKRMPLLIPVIKTQLTSHNPKVKIAAIKAVGKMDQESALKELLEIAKEGNPQEIQAVQEALLQMDGRKINSAIAKELPSLPKDAQLAMLSVLAAKGAQEQFKQIHALTSSQDPELRHAAFAALETTSGQEQLGELFTLLNQSRSQEEVTALQQAIVYALRDLADNQAQAERTIAQMEKAEPAQQIHYYPILSAVSGDQALTAVRNAYQSGPSTNQAAAMQALSQWKEEPALPVLREIVKQTQDAETLDAGLKGILRLVNASTDLKTDQKVLFLKDAMGYAQTVAQKRAVIRALAAHKTFPALAFAGKFFSDAQLAPQVASTVMEIALDEPSINGDLVKQHLNTTLQVLKGQDSEYLREAIRKHLSEMDDQTGFVEVFNGKDLTGWKGLVENPIARRKMSPKVLAEKQAEADRIMREGWEVQNGELVFLGKGDNLATTKDYGNVEMWVDWKIYDDGHKDGDAGIYLKGTPQVQIWDTSRVDVGAEVGSGGLYNNQTHPSKPLVVADNPLGEWNTFHIKMVDDKVTVHLNGVLVTDNILLENYWDRNLPLYAKEQIELQAHGSRIGYRDIYIKELGESEVFQLSQEEKAEGFQVLFDGTNLDSWMGNTKDYTIVNNELVIQPNEGSGGNLYTQDSFGDFVFRFEFKLTEGANNGLGVRAPLEGDVAYEGIEIQILDDTADIYKDLQDYQYHGSLYGVMKAKRGYLRPVGEWNMEEVQVKGDHFKVILNGTTILDGSISDAKENGTLDGQEHPGLFRDSGRIAFLGHGSKVYFKNIRVKKL